MGLIDLGNMSQVGAVPPDGAYPVLIDKIDSKPSKKGDSTNLFVTYTILSAPENPEWEGKQVKETINVQESTLWKVQAFLEGATGKEWRDDEMQLDPDDLRGCELIIEGVAGEYNGQKQFQVNNYYPAGTDLSAIE